jgi:hypothetical protein
LDDSFYLSLVRQYFAAYDGTPKEFEEVESLFDAAFHKKFALVRKTGGRKYIDDMRGNNVDEGKVLDRDAVKELHASYLNKGTKITLIHYRRIGLDCYDCEFRIENADEDEVYRVVYTIEDGKIERSQEVNNDLQVIRAKCSSALHTFNVFNKYPTNM